MSTVHLFAECFSESDSLDPFVATPCRPLWERWMRENPDVTRLFLRIYHPERMTEDQSFLIPVGDPCASNGISDALYLPMWMIDANQYKGSGEEVVIEILDAQTLPKATRIVLKPIDSALHEVDVVQVFERCFSRLGVLQQGRMYLIPLEELGGYQVPIHVETLEPAAEVYLDGDDVPLEFTRAVDYVEPAQQRPPTPIPTAPPVLAADQPDLMIPPNFLVGSGGAPVEQAYQQPPRSRNNLQRQNHYPRGFIPFSGEGHFLGGK